jgi:hypothetical protein
MTPGRSGAKLRKLGFDVTEPPDVDRAEDGQRL